jgi:signal transduction histidine kinase
VVDQLTRRALHDEILPALHLAVLQLNSADRQQPAIQETLSTLADAHQRIADLLAHSQPAATHAPDPCDLVASLGALVEREFIHSFQQIEWRSIASEDEPGQEGVADAVFVDPIVGEVLLGAAREAIRNAAAHGRGSQPDRPLFLRIGLYAKHSEIREVILTIADNGVGIDAENTVTSAFPGGSGNGLALHSTLLAMVGGYLAVESPPEGGTLVKIVIQSRYMC